MRRNHGLQGLLGARFRFVSRSSAPKLAGSAGQAVRLDLHRDLAHGGARVLGEQEIQTRQQRQALPGFAGTVGLEGPVHDSWAPHARQNTTRRPSTEQGGGAGGASLSPRLEASR
jgi:hypothetical protein